MGERGPAATPTEILAQRGSKHAKARVQAGEPVDPVAAPECPAWLKGEARQEWFRVVPILLARRTLCEADMGHLAGMCDWWGQYVSARRRVRKITSASPYHGHLIDHPRVVMSQAWKAYADAARQFGLSPASKTRVRADGKPESNPKSRFFSGPRLASG